MISRASASEIQSLIEGFLDRFIAKLRLRHVPEEDNAAAARAGALKPYHRLLLPPRLMALSQFERPFSTALGKLFESCAKVIAEQDSDEAANQYRVIGTFSLSTSTRIEEIRSDIEHNGMLGRYRSFVKQVSEGAGARSVSDSIPADLYVRRGESRWYFEMKSAKPNKDQCLGATVKLLKMHAMHGGPPDVLTYYAMPYNPYGNREGYQHSFALKLLDLDSQVLLGPEFWDLLGGPGTEAELLGIFATVGEARASEVASAILASG